MTRRRQTDADQAVGNLYDLLLELPTWVGPVLAVVSFVFLVSVLPNVTPAGNPVGLMIAALSRALAPFVGVIILGVWIVAEFGKRTRHRLLDQQSGVASIRVLSWQEFERLVGEAYRRQGYAVEERGGNTSDGGIDLVLRMGDETVVVQCKQWKAWKVGVKPVRELYGVMVSEKATRAVLATCGRFTRFTRDAVQFAEGKPVEALSGEKV